MQEPTERPPLIQNPCAYTHCFREQQVLFKLGSSTTGSRHILSRPVLPQTSCGKLQTEGT